MKESSSQSNHSENTTMNEILIAFSQKYNGHFFRILEALHENEKLTNEELNHYLNHVEEMHETILSDKYPSSIRKIPNPPFVLYYEGNLRRRNPLCDTVRRGHSAVRILPPNHHRTAQYDVQLKGG